MRRQGRPQHELPSFARYLNKVFDFRSASDTLTDARQNPDITAPAVFRAVFHGFLFRLSSFQELESELATPGFQRWIGAERSLGDDVLRYSLCGFDLAHLETILVQVNRTLKRNKAFDPGRVQGRIVAALDGTEILSSYSRCCETCLERRIECPQPDGSVQERIQYYHRLVGCQIVSSPVKPLLALEWVQPGEGEDTAALRFFERISELYGPRFFDILLLDSLYAQAPVLRLLIGSAGMRSLPSSKNGEISIKMPWACFKRALPTGFSSSSRKGSAAGYNSGTLRICPLRRITHDQSESCVPRKK